MRRPHTLLVHLPQPIHANTKKNKEIKSKMSKLNSCPNGFQARKYTNTKSRLTTTPSQSQCPSPYFSIACFFFLFVFRMAGNPMLSIPFSSHNQKDWKKEQKSKVFENNHAQTPFSSLQQQHKRSNFRQKGKHFTHHRNWWHLIITHNK